MAAFDNMTVCMERDRVADMKTILVDDESLGLSPFEQACREAKGIELVGKFYSGEEALLYAGSHRVEFALMDIKLNGIMDGIELGKQLKRLHPDMILIYVTSYSKYIVEALRIKADYCIMKPYDENDIMDAFKRVKLLSMRLRRKTRVVTFGHFEVYVDRRPVYFRNGKAKELFAFCIHREGASVTMEEAIDILWPDRPYDERVKRLYRKAVGAVQEALADYGVEDTFINKRGSCYVERDKIECDLYQFLEEGSLSISAREFLDMGYLADYSWAECRNAHLMGRIPYDENIWIE